MKNQNFFVLLLINFSFSLVAFSQLPGGLEYEGVGLEHENSGNLGGGDCDVVEEGVFNHVKIVANSSENSVLDMNGGEYLGWNNQIRFFNSCDDSEGKRILQHVIATHSGSERLIIAPGFYGEASDVMEVHGRITIGSQQAPDELESSSTILNNYKLFVAGGVLAEEIRVATGWADYVFYDDYKLRPLSEVRTYIDSNGHLPDVLPAKEIETNGMNVAEVTVQQQVKIEELFLYILDMEERLEKLEAENKVLKKNQE